MDFLAVAKYLLRGKIYEFCGKSGKALTAYGKAVARDYLPNRKFVNYKALIEKSASSLYAKHYQKDAFFETRGLPTHVLILNSELYDTGGHTELLLRHVETFAPRWHIGLFFTNIFGRASGVRAPRKIEKLRRLVSEYVEVPPRDDVEKRAVFLYDYIVKNRVTTVEVNLHPHDVVGCAVLFWLKRHSDVNIVFWNHADHIFCLGPDYADVILTRCKGGQPFSPYLRDCGKAKDLPFLMRKERNCVAPDILARKRAELGIPSDAFLTLTGCNFEKLGDDYFTSVRRILEAEPGICHMLVSSMTEARKNAVIERYQLPRDRFFVLDFQADFALFIQLANLYIDSFPQGSALTLVDFIKYGKPVVVKINRETPFRSFEEYLYDGYELDCETPGEVVEKTLWIARNPAAYQKLSARVAEFYEERYAPEGVISEYEKLIR